MNRWMDRQMANTPNRQKDGQMHGWMKRDGSLEGWTDGWVGVVTLSRVLEGSEVPLPFTFALPCR